MHTILLVIHVFVAIGLVSLVLLQQGKGSDMGAGFGAGSSGTVFGARGAASFLSKVTGGFALLFFLTSIGLAVMATRAAEEPKSVLGDEVEEMTMTETITLDPSMFVKDEEVSEEADLVDASEESVEPADTDTDTDTDSSSYDATPEETDPEGESEVEESE